jgi:hypothetical protein
MGKTAIVTTIIGERHKKISELTLPSQIAYANKVNADFIIYNHDQYIINSHGSGIQSNKQVPLIIDSKKMRIQEDHRKKMPKSDFGSHNKMNLVELLSLYERILYLDIDIIIRDDSPDIFKIVPKDCIGMWKEPVEQNRHHTMKSWCDFYNLDLKKWNGSYYNGGVILFSRGHEKLFNVKKNLPTKHDLPEDIWYEQTLLNSNIFENKLKMFELSYHFNRLFFLDQIILEHRYESFFIHYGGSWNELSEGNTDNPKMLIDLIKYDIEIWKKNSPDHLYGKINQVFKEIYKPVFWEKDYYLTTDT